MLSGALWHLIDLNAVNGFKSRLKIENDGKGAYGKDVLDNGNYRVKLHPHPSPMSGDQTDTEMVENVQC